MTQMYKRSNEPVFWGLFGFGGTVITFAMPALLVCMIIAGFTDGLQNFHIVDVVSHWWGAGALFLIIFGTAFHCIHRFYFSLCDLKCHTGLAGQIILYGLATLISLAAAATLGYHYFSSTL